MTPYPLHVTSPPLESRWQHLAARLRRGVGEISRFGVVGIFAFVIDVTIFNVLVHGGNSGPLADKPLTAKTLATVIATLFAYWANRHWTWRHRQRRGFVREYSLYFAFNAVGLFLMLLPLAISRYVLGYESALADNISANVVGVALSTAFRFIAYRRWVFPAVQEEAKVGGPSLNQGEPATD
jgi:putative flippase GtrA